MPRESRENAARAKTQRGAEEFHFWRAPHWRLSSRPVLKGFMAKKRLGIPGEELVLHRSEKGPQGRSTAIEDLFPLVPFNPQS